MTRRPSVVVYVTREHPVTGADELLVFDLAEYGADVPSGVIEPSEAVDDAARREVREATGVETRLVRLLGSSGGSQFVQSTPLESTPDEWEHGGDRCRWAPVRTRVRGNRGVLLSALLRQRVVAYVTRERDGRTELLTIEHGDIPDASVEVPAGRLDPGENLEEGVHREVEEETGVTGLRVLGRLADGEEFERLYGAGVHESFAFHAMAGSEGPDEWEHQVTGTGADAGLTYLCRWVPLRADLPLWGSRDPLLERLVETAAARRT